METVKVGIREFRDNLSSYLLQSEKTVAITRHGDTVGFFIPTRPNRSEAEKKAFDELAARWQATLDAAGLTEEIAMAEYERLRAEQRR